MKRSILFIDDDPVALRLIIDTFKQHFGDRFSYQKAGSAEEAEEVLLEDLGRRGALPKLIVSDWIMPGKRGDELLNIIGDEYPEIRLVLHSGLSDQAMEDRLKQSCQLVASLRKPWDGRQHFELIAQALET